MSNPIAITVPKKTGRLFSAFMHHRNSTPSSNTEIPSLTLSRDLGDGPYGLIYPRVPVTASTPTIILAPRKTLPAHHASGEKPNRHRRYRQMDVFLDYASKKGRERVARLECLVDRCGAHVVETRLTSTTMSRWMRVQCRILVQVLAYQLSSS